MALLTTETHRIINGSVIGRNWVARTIKAAGGVPVNGLLSYINPTDSQLASGAAATLSITGVSDAEQSNTVRYTADELYAKNYAEFLLTDDLNSVLQEPPDNITVERVIDVFVTTAATPNQFARYTLDGITYRNAVVRGVTKTAISLNAASGSASITVAQAKNPAFAIQFADTLGGSVEYDLTAEQKALVSQAVARHAAHSGPGVLNLGLVADTHAAMRDPADTPGVDGRSVERARVNYVQQAYASALMDLDGIVLLGDNQDGSQSGTGITTLSKSEAMALYGEMAGWVADAAAPVFPVRGNHDDNTDSSHNTNVFVSPAEQYDSFNSVFDMKNGAVHDSTNPKSLYYYRDYPDAQTRVIFLDAIDYPVKTTGSAPLAYWADTNAAPATTGLGYGGRQIEWLAAEALDFSGKADIGEWAVLVFSHTFDYGIGSTYRFQNGETAMKILDAFNTKGTYTWSNSDPDWAASGTVDFTGDLTRGVLGAIRGHYHKDYTTAPGDVSAANNSVKNPYTFQLSGIAAGFIDKDGVNALIAVDRTHNVIHLTAIRSAAALAYDGVLTDRDIPIVPYNPTPYFLLAQGSYTDSGVTVTVNGNRVTLNGQANVSDRMIKLTNGFAAANTAAAAPAAWLSQLVVNVSPSDTHSLMMRNVTGTANFQGSLTLLRTKFQNDAHVAAACPNPYLDRYEPDEQTVASGADHAAYIAVLLGAGGSPYPVFTNYSFDVELYISGERIV